MRFSFVAALLGLTGGTPALAQDMTELPKLERTAEMIWNAVKVNVPASTDGLFRGAHLGRTDDGSTFWAGYTRRGKQVMIETPGHRGMKLTRVINFGPGAAVGDASVTRSWSTGEMLMTVKEAGFPSRHLLLRSGRAPRGLTVCQARQLIRRNGRFRPLPSSRLGSSIRATVRKMRGSR